MSDDLIPALLAADGGTLRAKTHRRIYSCLPANAFPSWLFFHFHSNFALDALAVFRPAFLLTALDELNTRPSQSTE